MSKKLLFRKRIPWSDKVQRLRGSPSFRATSEGRYVIRQAGERVVLNAKVAKEGKHIIDITLHTESGKEVGNMSFNFYNKTSYHRLVEPEFRGYNLGRLLFRLAEQESLKLGGKKLNIVTSREDTLVTALVLGYSITAQSEGRLKKALGIAEDQPLPKRQKLIEMLRNQSAPNFPQIETSRLLKRN